MSESESLEQLRAALAAEIARRRAVERELQQTTAALQRSQHEVGQFASIASHDLRAPLQKVRAFADLLAAEHGAQLGDDGRDYLHRLTRSVLRMEKIVDDLVTLARVDAKDGAFTPVDLASVARDVVSGLEATLQSAGARVDVGSTLPTIAVDPAQMQQLLHELIVNAVKFRQESRPLVVQIGARVVDAADRRCEIEVADNGIGFDSRHAETIFRPFERLHGPQQYEGSGIGLAVCARIAERHGGSISAIGRAGEGATFVVTLPMRHFAYVTAPVF